MTTTRQEILDAYNRLEIILQDLLRDPGPQVAGGAIVRGPDGKPVPNKDVIAQATYSLAHLRQCRGELLGQDLGCQN